MQVVAQSMSRAKTEDECYAMVVKLLVALFGVARCSVALLTEDKQHVVGVQMAIVQEDMANVFHKDNSGFKFPLEGTVFGHISQTHEVYYNPDLTANQHWNHQAMMRDKGMMSVINAPLLAHGKFVGALSMVVPKVNHFSLNDILLVKDIAACLTANLLLRRLQDAQRVELTTVQNMLHALIPKKVLKKIAHHWHDRFFDDEKRREGSGQEGYASTDGGGVNEEEVEELRNAVVMMQTISSRHDADESSSGDVTGKLEVLPSAVPPAALKPLQGARRKETSPARTSPTCSRRTSSAQTSPSQRKTSPTRAGQRTTESLQTSSKPPRAGALSRRKEPKVRGGDEGKTYLLKSTFYSVECTRALTCENV
jgi:hypothetical protein